MQAEVWIFPVCRMQGTNNNIKVFILKTDDV